jgi:glutathione synthase/RimK-type ligase-like ATP-grasp enzyme
MGFDDNNRLIQSDSLPFPYLYIEPEPESVNRSRPIDLMQKVAQISGRMQPTGASDKILIINSIGRRDTQAEEIVAELALRGALVFWLDTSAISNSCRLSIELGKKGQSPGLLALPAGDLALEEVKSVWFRGPHIALEDPPDMPGESAGFVNRETEAALFGLFGILEHAFWVNRPDAVRAAEDKLVQLKLAESLGWIIPRTLVTNDPKRARSFFESCGGEMIIKTFRRLAYCQLDQEYLILTNRVLREHLDQSDRMRHVPCLLQEYIPKEIELRVTVIGRRVFAVEIHSQDSPISRDDYRRYDFSRTPYLPHTLPQELESACLNILDHYGLSFAALDLIRRPDGAYVFLEINANAQFLWIEDLTGMPLRQAVADMLMRGSRDE